MTSDYWLSTSRQRPVAAPETLTCHIKLMFHLFDLLFNKITFKRTRSLSNAACFKHENNVCASTVGPKCINFTSGRKSVNGNKFSNIDFLYNVESFAVRRCFCVFWRFFTAHAQFRPYYYFRFKVWHHNRILRTSFPIKTRSFRARDTIFGDFCDHNVCACAVSILILLPVANLSREMDSTTPISYKTRTFRL